MREFLPVALLILMILLLSIILMTAAMDGRTSGGYLMVRIPKDKYDAEVVWEQVVIATADGSVPVTRVKTNNKWYMIILPNEPGLRVTVENKNGKMNGCEIVYLDHEMAILQVVPVKEALEKLVSEA